MTNAKLIGLSSVQHFLVDGLCICCMFLLAGIYGESFGAYGDRVSMGTVLIYNVLAFMSQPLTGMMADRMERRHWLLIVSSLLLTLAVASASLIPTLMRVSPNLMWDGLGEWMMVLVAVLLGAGNSFFHVWGGKQTVVMTGNDIRALGVFVSTGALGLAVGFVCRSWTLLYGLLLAIVAVAIVYLKSDGFSRNEEGGMRNENCQEADQTTPNPSYSGGENHPQGNLLPPSSFLLPRIKLSGFPDIQVVPGDELIESLASSYSRVGMDETMVITRSNKRANIYNQGIRNTVLDREDELCRGDLLMIVKNNYFWSQETGVRRQESGGRGQESGGIDFIANGDRAVVQRVRNIHELYGFRFAEVTMTFPDYDDYELTATVLLDTLTSEAPALIREQQEQLFNTVMEDYADIPAKADRIAKLKADRYYNALQVKFAYAVTCHKAQGGQWAHIYLDQGYMTDDMLTPDYIHWLYTAFTRATEKLFLVNWPKTQISVD